MRLLKRQRRARRCLWHDTMAPGFGAGRRAAVVAAAAAMAAAGMWLYGCNLVPGPRLVQLPELPAAWSHFRIILQLTVVDGRDGTEQRLPDALPGSAVVLPVGRHTATVIVAEPVIVGPAGGRGAVIPGRRRTARCGADGVLRLPGSAAAAMILPRPLRWPRQESFLALRMQPGPRTTVSATARVAGGVEPLQDHSAAHGRRRPRRHRRSPLPNPAAARRASRIRESCASASGGIRPRVIVAGTAAPYRRPGGRQMAAVRSYLSPR